MASSDSDCVDNPQEVIGDAVSQETSSFYGRRVIPIRKRVPRDVCDEFSEDSIDDSDLDPYYSENTTSSSAESDSKGVCKGVDDVNVGAGPSGMNRIVDSEDESCEDESGNCKKIVKRGRSRELRFDDWAQNIAKARRNKGLDYVSYTTKKTVSAR